MARYKQYMEHEKGNKPLTIATTMHRLRGLLGDCDVPLHSITEHDAAELYQARRGKVTVDTYRNELGQVKTFMEWCRDQPSAMDSRQQDRQRTAHARGGGCIAAHAVRACPGVRR